VTAAVAQLRAVASRHSPRWLQLVLGLAALAVILRIIAIVGAPAGGYDLGWYQQVGEAALDGNPYTAHLIPPTDVPPLQALTFGLLGEPNAVPLRVLFLLADVGTLLMLGLLMPRPTGWRLNVMCWLTFNPFLLMAWDITAEDKNLYIFCTVAAIVGIETGRLAWSWLATGAFLIFKFVGGFLIPPLAWVTMQSRGRRVAILSVLGVAVLFAASNLPWFPHSLDAYGHRGDRASAPLPGHTSWTILLSSIHLYDPAIVKVVLVGGVLAAYGLLVAGRISATESMVLALIATFIALPDNSIDRIMLLTFLFILIVQPSTTGWTLLWAASVVAAAAVQATHNLLPVPGFLDPLERSLKDFVGPRDKAFAIALLNLPLFVSAGLYVVSKARPHRGHTLAESAT
jgi:hypothetical protein